MKKISKLIVVLALGCLGFVIVGCDPETHPDPHLVQSANSQRQAQTPGQTPPTGPGH